MSIAAYCRNIEELEALTYTDKGWGLEGNGDLNSPFLDVNKADAPVVSTTTGVFNAVFGAQAWVQLNQEANTWGVLPKTVHRHSGVRVITARAATLPYGGRAEGAALPDTIKPTFATFSAKPKTSANTFETSETQEFLANSEDDAYGNMEQQRAYAASEHREDLNVQLNTQNGTPASNNFESIDRVAGSYAEITNNVENNESTAYTANDLDIYSQDRDAAASWVDAYVNYAASSGVVRSMTDTLIQTLVQNVMANGANPGGQFFQTGWDTWAVINQLYEPQVRYNLIGEATIKPGVNGIETVEGYSVGLQVAKLMHAPVILSKNTVVDTGGVSRVYLLDASNPEGFDLPRLSVRIAKPTQYFESGMNKGDPFPIAKFSTKGMYRTMGELICTFFAVQGKLRDLKQ